MILKPLIRTPTLFRCGAVRNSRQPAAKAQKKFVMGKNDKMPNFKGARNVESFSAYVHSKVQQVAILGAN